MKKPLLLLTLLAAATAAQATDTAYSPPVGGMTISVPVGQTVSVALPLLHDSAGSGAMTGTISGVGSNYIDVTGAGWSPGGLSNAANPYYVRIKSGSFAGRVFLVSTTANTDSRVYLNNDGTDLTLTGGLVAGDAYELILADTLSSFFGTSLQGGADAASADNVQVWGGASWQIYYYNTTRSRWERSGITTISANNIVLRPDRGIMVTRRGATDFKMYVCGRVPNLAPQYFHSRPGTTFLSTGIPVSQTLGQLSLNTRALGWQAGTSISNADTVQVWGGASWQIYYYDSTNARWQRDGLPTVSANNVSLAGKPIMIKRINSAAATDSIVALPIPYVIN